MEVALILKILVLIIGFYMAWNIGANDVSNAMGTSVGSRALTLKKAVFLAAILEFSGAYLIGANVSETMRREIIEVELFASDPITLMIGMCAALLGTSIWLQTASYFGWPVSTTHAIVGAIVGFGVITQGFQAVSWTEVNSILLSWVVSPLLSGAISYLLFSFLQKKILFAMDPTEVTVRMIPFLIFFVFETFGLSIIFNGFSHFDFHLSFLQALIWSSSFSLVLAFISFMLVRKFPLKKEGGMERKVLPQSVISLEKAIKHMQRVRVSAREEAHDETSKLLDQMKGLSTLLKKESHFFEKASDYHIVERLFSYFQIISACFVAFAHGANDVSNAIGPVAAVLDSVDNGILKNSAPVPSWLLAFGGIGIVIGLATWGWRVIETIGKKITELTPTRGFSAEFGAAITILIASKLGLPISTTHCLVGSVLGVGLARGIRALNLRTLREIVLSWIVTIPVSGIMSGLCFYLLRAILL